MVGVVGLVGVFLVVGVGFFVFYGGVVVFCHDIGLGGVVFGGFAYGLGVFFIVVVVGGEVDSGADAGEAEDCGGGGGDGFCGFC